MGTSDDEHGRVSWTTPGDVDRLIKTERDLGLWDFDPMAGDELLCAPSSEDASLPADDSSGS